MFRPSIALALSMGAFCLSSTVLAGEDAASQEVQILKAEEKILRAYHQAPEALRGRLFQAIQGRILSFKEKIDLSKDAKDLLDQSYREIKRHIQVEKQGDEQDRAIRLLFGKMSVGDVTARLSGAITYDVINDAVKDLRNLNFSSAKPLPEGPSGVLRSALERWVGQWKSNDASPESLEKWLPLLPEGLSMTGGDESQLPQLVSDFAIGLARSLKSSSSVEAAEKLNPSLEKIRTSALLGDQPGALARVKKNVGSLLLSTARSSKEFVDLETVGVTSKELMASAGAEPMGRADLVGVRYWNPAAKELGRRIDAQGISASESFYLIPKTAVCLEYQLFAKEAAAGAPGRTVSVLLDVSTNKGAGGVVKPSLPLTYVPGRVFVHVESLAGSPSYLVDASCWSWETLIDRMGRYLTRGTRDKEALAGAIEELLKLSNAPPGSMPDRTKIKEVTGLKGFQSLFDSLPDKKAVFLLQRSSEGSGDLLAQFFRRNMLFDPWEAPPDKALAAKILDPALKEAFGFNSANVPCVLSSVLNEQLVFSPAPGGGDFGGICTVILLKKK